VAETSHATRQAVLYCPYCAEETLFPLEEGGWECRSCMRAFSVTFLGLSSRGRSGGAPETSQQESA
jgi:ribosomal protein L37AE/L43A